MTAFRAAKSSSDLFQVQKSLAEEIIRSEAEAASAQERHHRRALRVIGDSVAAKCLTKHAIRNLVRAEPAPALLSQGQAFRSVLSSAEEWASEGASVLLPDLTTSIRVGDVLVCGCGDVPHVVEFKSSVPRPEYQSQGRRGRQVVKALSTLRYLREGKGFVAGSPVEKLAIEIDTPTEHRWSAVDAVVTEAPTCGLGTAAFEDEFIW